MKDAVYLIGPNDLVGPFVKGEVGQDERDHDEAQLSAEDVEEDSVVSVRPDNCGELGITKQRQEVNPKKAMKKTQKKREREVVP